MYIGFVKLNSENRVIGNVEANASGKSHAYSRLTDS